MVAEKENNGIMPSQGAEIDGLRTVLLFLSREKLTDEQSAYLKRVLVSDADVDDLLRQCRQRLIAPIALTHVMTLGAERFSDRLDEWKTTRRSLAAYSMRLFAEMAKFHEFCIESTGSDHVFVKGPSLAVRHYANPTLRMCRDIDVLIPKAEIGNVVRAALSEGYTIANAGYDSVAPRCGEAVEALVSMSDVVTMRSPNGVFFEIHRTIDRNAGLFDSDRLVEVAEPLNFFGRQIKVLPPELLLCYIAYHSTQHTWARLNWFTDVHAILSHDEFDRTLCLDWARSIGLDELVSACMEFDDWCSVGAPATVTLGREAQRLYDLFSANIHGGLDREKELIVSQHKVGLPRRFRAARHARQRAMLKHMAQAFAPRFELYSKFPMKKGFWWVYSVIHPPLAFIGLIKNYASRRRLR